MDLRFDPLSAFNEAEEPLFKAVRPGGKPVRLVDTTMKFDVRFYLVSILFIIFDLEVAFLFPWAVSLMKLPHDVAAFAFWSMLVFLGVLTVGFIYEWKKGALEWE